MSIDLRTEKPGGTWVRRFGNHEASGFGVSVGDKSAHVTLTALGIMFAVDRQDVPAAWDAAIDVIKLREELIATIVRRMSAEVLEALFGEIHSQRQSAFWDGEHATRTKIREALGL
jgi:hypothetical protein